MSALEQFTPSPADRRRAPRLELQEAMSAYVGRGEATLIDVSVRGTRIRHRVAIGRGTTVRFSFDWKGEHFAATAEVLSSRVIALDGPTYESRLHFVEVAHLSERLLRTFLATLENEEVRRALENMQGWSSSSTDTHSSPADRPARGFVRCRNIGMRWEKKWTRDAAQPDDGFTLPAALSEIELAKVCRSYERLDDTGRSLLRLIAAAIVGGEAEG